MDEEGKVEKVFPILEAGKPIKVKKALNASKYCVVPCERSCAENG